MCDFKKGDKVRCKEVFHCSNTLILNKIYEILDIFSTDYQCTVKVLNECGEYKFYGYTRFELVEQEIDFLKLLDEFS